MMEQRPLLAQRTAADPHPFVDPGALRAQLDSLGQGANERLVIERAKAAK